MRNVLLILTGSVYACSCVSTCAERLASPLTSSVAESRPMQGRIISYPKNIGICDAQESDLVFEEDFDSISSGFKAPKLLNVRGSDVKGFGNTFNGHLPQDGYNGEGCWMLDFDLPPQGMAVVNFPIADLEPTGLFYKLLMKFVSTPAAGPADLGIAINFSDHPFAHTIYHVESLENKPLKTGEWMEKVLPIWRRHFNETYTGWMKIEGDTSGYFWRKPEKRKFTGFLMYIVNSSRQDRHVKLFLDDIKIIRRDIMNAPEMKAVLNASHPLLKYTRAQILLARKKISMGVKRPEFVDTKLKLANEWSFRDIAVPNELAGYPTAYRCEADDCDGFLRPDLRNSCCICKKCGKRHTGGVYDKLLIHERHQELGKATESLGFAYQWTDDKRYAKKAEEILLAYADVVPNLGGLGHNWLGTCWLIEDFLLGYDYVYEALSSETRKKINENFLKKIRTLYHYNHHYPEGYIRLSRICAWISILVKDADWINALLFTDVGNREVTIRYGLTDDMISMKGAAYHACIVRGLGRLGVTLENCGIQFFDARIKSVYDAVLKQTFPDNSLPAFGQSQRGFPTYSYEFHIPYEYYRDANYLPLFLDKLKKDRPFFNVEIPDHSDKLRMPSTHFQSLGMTMLRTQPENDTVAALSWGAPQRNDPARLDFQLYGAGGQLIWSSGTTYYGNPLMEKWYQRSLSRNMIVVDEGTQLPVSGKCLFLQTAGDIQVVAAELQNAYPKSRIVRIVALFKTGEVALIDLFSSLTPRTVDWVCHLPGKVETQEELIVVKAPFKLKNGYDTLQDLRTLKSNETLPPLVLSHKKKNSQPYGARITMAKMGATKLFLAKGEMQYVKTKPEVCLLRRENISSTAFATLIQPFKGKTPPETGSIKVECCEASSRSPSLFDKVSIELTLPSSDYVIHISEKGSDNDGVRDDMSSKFDVDIIRR